MHSKLKKINRKVNTKTHPWSIYLLKATFGIWLFVKYNLKIVNRDLLKKYNGPYLLIPNHTTWFDAFMLGTHIPKPVYYVTGDAPFRNKLVAHCARLIGAIPKSRGIPDMETVRNIMKSVRSGNSLCLFAEGEQTWDGTTLPLIETSAKLVKLLKVPVVRVMFKGSFASHPRWSFWIRRGRVVIEFDEIMTVEDIKSKKSAEILSFIQEKLNYNEWDWMKDHHIAYKNFWGTEGMSKALYVCPKCHGISTMKGLGPLFYCEKCKYIVRYNSYCQFVNKKNPPIFSNIADWNAWQKNYLENWIEKQTKENRKKILLLNNVTVYIGYKIEPMIKYASGQIRLSAEEIIFIPEKKHIKPLNFHIKTIEGVSFLRKTLEFYVDGTLYRFKFFSKRSSSLKWHTAIEYLRKEYLKIQEAEQ